MSRESILTRLGFVLGVIIGVAAVWLLSGCSSTTPIPPATPPVVSLPTPATPTPTPIPDQPPALPQFGYIQVCVDGLTSKLPDYPVEVGGQRLHLTITKPCEALGVRLPEGASYEVVAHSGAWGLVAVPNRQRVTVVANATTTARVWVGWK